MDGCGRSRGADVYQSAAVRERRTGQSPQSPGKTTGPDSRSCSSPTSRFLSLISTVCAVNEVVSTVIQLSDHLRNTTAEHPTHLPSLLPSRPQGPPSALKSIHQPQVPPADRPRASATCQQPWPTTPPPPTPRSSPFPRSWAWTPRRQRPRSRPSTPSSTCRWVFWGGLCRLADAAHPAALACRAVARLFVRVRPAAGGGRQLRSPPLPPPSTHPLPLPLPFQNRQIKGPGMPMTRDYRIERVFIMVDEDNKVSRPPRNG
jgi:hypothetical protein